MLIRKAQVYRLYPTAERAEKRGQWAGAARFTFNLAREQRRDWYRPGGRYNFGGPCREVTALRAEVDRLREVPVHPLQQAIEELDRAYQNGWAGRAQAPQPRKRGLSDGMRFPDRATFDFRRISRPWGEVKRPKPGRVRGLPAPGRTFCTRFPAISPRTTALSCWRNWRSATWSARPSAPSNSRAGTYAP